MASVLGLASDISALVYAFAQAFAVTLVFNCRYELGYHLQMKLFIDEAPTDWSGNPVAAAEASIRIGALMDLNEHELVAAPTKGRKRKLSMSSSSSLSS